MCWLYILQNESIDKYYIGSTTNLERRLKEHLRGLVRTTRVFSIFKLAYKEKFDKIEEARKREKQLKLYKSKKYIKWLIATKKGP
jgi:putative endonuclease